MSELCKAHHNPAPCARCLSEAGFKLQPNKAAETKPLSLRGQDWQAFSAQVLDHIENYTVPQYGDKGEDLASDWAPEMLLEQSKKYNNRYGKNQRPGQEMLDFLKSAHYVQMGATKHQEAQDAAR